jgi:hypothetical protein
MPDILKQFPDGPLSLALAAAGVLAVLAGGWWLWRFQQRRRRDLDRRLRDACRAVLTNFIIPDGNGDEIQVQYALLTGRGILVIDIKDVEGHVFGSEAMQDWTVIADDRRFTFANPQPGLWDRVAAVKRLTPEVPVTGFVGFTGRAQFTKGQPRSVTLLEPLLQDLEKEAANAKAAAEGYLDAWNRLRQAATAVRMDYVITTGSR